MSPMPSVAASAALQWKQTFRLSSLLKLHVVQGSVLDFACTNICVGAIVNAANEKCLGGGAVDGAITAAGGEQLAADRLALPQVLNGYGELVRCRTGSAVITGSPQTQYGTLNTPYVIHAVGPNYWEYEETDDTEQGHLLLQTAYQAALDRAHETGIITDVAFALLSAGVFRGPENSLDDVLRQAVIGLKAWSPPPRPIIDDSKNDREDSEDKKLATETFSSASSSALKNVYLCGYTDKECDTLQAVCQDILGEPMQTSEP